MRTVRLRGVVLAAVGVSGVAAAADGPTGNEPEIVVTATGQTRASSSMKTATPIIENAQTVSVITRGELDLRASPTIADALSYTAGVQSEAFGIDSRVDEVSVRGFGAGGFSTNNNFVDGLRLPAGGQWTRTGFDPFALNQVEVLKGPASVLYGQVAPGGIVNIVSKRPTDRTHGEIMLQSIGFTDLDRFNMQGSADYGGPIDRDGRVSARIVGLGRYGPTQVRGTDIARYYVSPSVTVHIGDDTDWTLLGQYQRDQGGATFQFLPSTGSLRKSNGRRIANDAFLGEPDWNQFDRNQYLAGSFLEHRFGEHVSLRNNTRYTHIDTIYRTAILLGDTLTSCPATIPGCIPGQTVQRRAVQGVGESDGVATDTQVEARFETGPLRHTLLGGFDYFHTDWEHYRDGVAPARVLPVLDIFDPQSRGSVGYASALSPQIYTEVVQSQKGLYGQDQIAVGGLRLTLGGRQDWARDNTTSPITGRTFRNRASKFTYRAGAVYLLPGGLAPCASYSTSFLPLTSDPSTALDGQPFRPTTGNQIEGGLRWQPRRNDTYVTFSAYQIKQNNLTTPDPGGQICGTSTCLVQTGQGRIRGLELEGRSSLPFGLSAVVTATKSWSRITKSNVAAQIGDRLPQVPEWLASVFLDYRIKAGALAGAGFGGGARYTGESRGNLTTLGPGGATVAPLAIPDYLLFDMFLRYDLGKANERMRGAVASLNMRNVANKTFVATCTGTAACYYGQGRSLTARLQFNW